MNILFITKGSFGTKDATGSMLNNVFDGMYETKILQFPLRPVGPNSATPISIVTTLPKVFFSVYSRLLYQLDSKTTNGRLRKLWKPLRSVLIFLDGLTPPVLFKKEIDYIDLFSPDVIYTLGADVKALRLSRKLAKHYRIKLVVHNMDDYYNIDFRSPHLMRRVYNTLLRKEYRLAYHYSNKSLGIGPKMAGEYSEEFGIPFDWVMNCVDVNKIEVDKTLNDQVSLIIFSGGLHGGRAQSLAQIASIVETLGSVKLEIYTSNKEIETNVSLFNAFKYTELHEYVEKERMFENLSRADILLHVESFEPNNIKYFRLSMSTKIPEYMAVGRPILCVGPESLSTVEFISKYEIGYVVNDTKEIETALIQLKEKKNRQLLVDNAIKVFNQYFKKEKMQERLIGVFESNM